MTVYQHDAITLPQIWLAFQLAYLAPGAPISPVAATMNPPLQLDNPFLINYVVYHHYRSLGWVVKGGIKFCVDYLLYKRGPVFHHAEYSIRPAVFQPPSHVALQVRNSCVPYIRRSCGPRSINF
jgi:hypothetical protein